VADVPPDLKPAIEVVTRGEGNAILHILTPSPDARVDIWVQNLLPASFVPLRFR
jgi:hypothetical protein